MATTAYMSLSLPDPGVTPGIGWATQLNAALTTVDAHDHSSGSGKSIRSAALSIDGDVSWSGYNLTTLRSARFQDLAAPPALVPDINELAVSGGNLYFLNSAGQQVQITAGAALNAASIGAIGGDYSTSTASEIYTSASRLFSFFQAANKYAGLDCGQVIIHENGATSPKGITLQSPAGLGADYALTLPTGLPGSTLPVLAAADGSMSCAKLVNSQQNFGTPSAATDVAIKSYVDGKVDLSDGSSGVTAGTNWAKVGTQQVYKQPNKLVTICLALTAYSGLGSTMATLPAGYRPATNTRVGITTSGGSVCDGTINTDGTITIVGAVANPVYVLCVTFKAP